MSEHRPFPPSPRRLALARLAGLTAASPLLVGAGALAAALAVAVLLAERAATRIGAWIVAAVSAADGARGSGVASEAASAVTSAVASTLLPLGSLAAVTVELVLPLAGAAAIAAFIVHVAQARAVWLPRRRKVPGAPALPREGAARTMLELAATAAIATLALAWLWLTAPALASLASDPRSAAAAIAGSLVTLAIGVIALGVLDALLRHRQLVAALAMTHDDKREDDRLAAADPRWRARRLAVQRAPAADLVARAAVVVVGDATAVAIEWDPLRQPVPLRNATGRDALAMQLIALARRHQVPVHRDERLARELAIAEGPVPDHAWPRLAEIVAATRRAR
jgi:flagellar biosynthesis protein FlhB